jgi:hypothetical protein
MKRILSILFVTVLLSSVPTFAVERNVKLSKKQLQTLIETAHTPEDHLRLARYYDQRASALLAESKEHQDMAEMYKKNPLTSSDKWNASTVGHCDYIANALRESAGKMTAMAASHRQMADDARKK